MRAGNLGSQTPRRLVDGEAVRTQVDDPDRQQNAENCRRQDEFKQGYSVPCPHTFG
jgi:hypothetical protein